MPIRSRMNYCRNCYGLAGNTLTMETKMKGITSMEVEMIVDHYKMGDIPQSMTMTIAGVRRKMYLLAAKWDSYQMAYVLKYKLLED